MTQLFRVLLPSWRFFDGVGEAPELYYRTSFETSSPWVLGIPKIQSRSWKKLFVNTEENFLFACHALLEYLKDDLRDGLDASVSLELIKNLTIYQMNLAGVSSTQFQFMLATTPNQAAALYVSPVLEVSP